MCCSNDILTSNDERESDALNSDHIIVREKERKPQMTTTVYTVLYCSSFMQHRLNEEYSEVSTSKKGQHIQMILENLTTK